MDSPAPSSAPAAPVVTSTPSSPASSPSPAGSSAGSRDVGSPAPQGASSIKSDAPAAPQGETKQERQARLLKYKVDGQELSLDVNSLSDEELGTKLQFAEAARKRMQEAAEVRKAWAELQEQIKSDPFTALQQTLGVDLRKLAEERLVEEFRQSQMPEPDRQRLQLEQQLKEREAQIAKYEQSIQAQRQQALEAQIIEQTQRDFSAALDSEQIPRNRATMKMMAEIALEALNHGAELSPAQIASEVNRRLSESNSHVIKSLKGEQLVKYLGADVVKEILRHEVERVKGKPPAFVEEKLRPPVDDDGEDPFNRKPNAISKSKDYQAARKAIFK